MTDTETSYSYKQAHYPNNCSWYRELIFLNGNPIGEIREPVGSTTRRRIYDVCKYVDVEIADGTVAVVERVTQFQTVCDCKAFVDAGGLR